MVNPWKPRHDHPPENQFFNNRCYDHYPQDSAPYSQIGIKEPWEQLHKPGRWRKYFFKLDVDFVQKIFQASKSDNHCRNKQYTKSCKGKNIFKRQSRKVVSKVKDQECRSYENGDFDPWLVQPIGPMVVIVNGQRKINYCLNKDIHYDQISRLPEVGVIFIWNVFQNSTFYELSKLMKELNFWVH